jgi:hypothetical protein
MEDEAEGEVMEYEPVGHGMVGFESRPMTSTGVGARDEKVASNTWTEAYADDTAPVESPHRRPYSAAMPVTRQAASNDPHLVTGARAMMRYRRTSRGADGTPPPPSSPTNAPKAIFQNPVYFSIYLL